MIGVIARDEQRATVEEFFELFKTPWEPYRERGAYDVLLTTDPAATVPPAKMILAFCPERMLLDDRHGIRIHSTEEGGEIEWGDSALPVYGKLAMFTTTGERFLSRREGEPIAVAIDLPESRILRLGYDLFGEVDHLLRKGQPVKHAGIPTLEIHISMLRQWILGAGVSLVEIPPLPYGYDFITCLTHDIDFMGIRDHVLDHTMFGFIYRSLVPKYLKGLDRKEAVARYLKNLRALLSLPLVQAGFLPDFWFPLDRYRALEKERKSTFFFIPFKDQPGDPPNGKPAKYRAARYDVVDHTDPIRRLKEDGREIGLHGIDAWRDPRKGKEEIDVIRRITGEEKIGARMHWLYFSDETPGNLEEAGASYDSTLGYNGTVGYRSGTTQVFRLPRSRNLYELPLHAQDTAMFYPDRMGISESEAVDFCGTLIGNFRSHGGAFTINWHDRSLAPERNWDTAYLALLELLDREKTWFATAGEAVSWFETRRSCRFEEAGSIDGVPNVTLEGVATGDSHPLTLRIHQPSASVGGEKRFRDVPLDSPRISGKASTARC